MSANKFSQDLHCQIKCAGVLFDSNLLSEKGLGATSFNAPNFLNRRIIEQLQHPGDNNSFMAKIPATTAGYILENTDL